MVKPRLLVDHERIDLVCDGVSRRAWVTTAPDEPLGTVQITVAAPVGTVIPRPQECWAVYPSDDGAAWVCAVEILDIDDVLITARLAPARRLQRRRHVRHPVGWEAALCLGDELPGGDDADDDDGDGDGDGDDLHERAGAPPLPATGPARGHLRLVSSTPAHDRDAAGVVPRVDAPAALPPRWIDATCVDLSAGGTRLRVRHRVDAGAGQGAAVRIAIPGVGSPILPGRVVEVTSSRAGHCTVRICFELPSIRMEDELSGIVVRAQFAERARRRRPS